MRNADKIRDDLFCQYCGRQCKNLNSLKTHEVRCKNNSNRIISKGNSGVTKGHKSWNKGLTKDTDIRIYNASIKISNILSGRKKRHLTESEKKNLSEKRNQYLINNGLNRWSNYKDESYAEQYFASVFPERFVRQYHILSYLIDFADVDNKIAYEIDGEQHYNMQERIDSDIKRDNLLLEKGWKTIRIRWSEYCKLSCNERSNFIEDLLGYKISGELDIKDYKIHKTQKDINNEARNKKYEEYKKIGKINKNGKISANMVSTHELNRRLNLILNSGVDLMKFGYVSKLVKETGLSIRIIEHTIKHFNIDHFVRKNALVS